MMGSGTELKNFYGLFYSDGVPAALAIHQSAVAPVPRACATGAAAPY